MRPASPSSRKKGSFNKNVILFLTGRFRFGRIPVVYEIVLININRFVEF